jgi:4-hydroxy-tetrahydrodipicolinate reductase
MTKIGIIGSAGRMGQALREAIAAAGQTHSGGVDKPRPEQVEGGDDLSALVAASDVLVDFSSPHALEANHRHRHHRP